LKDRAAELRQKSGSKPFAGLRNQIAVEEVYFAYQERGIVLENINIRIPQGTMIGLVGESGAGKSSLIDVIMGFNEPSRGTVTIDGVPLFDYDINSYRKRIGYVPQDPILFNASIRENLLWAKPDATNDDIDEACRRATAMEFITDLPEGQNTVVGDRGVRLSGGQCQRVALARAILRRPDLLILDEATSSLDTHSERLIQESIDALAKEATLIVIAHRLSTIVNADYIYVLEKGRVVEEGTYEHLTQLDGRFNKMVELQALKAVS
jgi:ABC-type multidrug transport system fused ATPase/permease subunit